MCNPLKINNMSHLVPSVPYYPSYARPGARTHESNYAAMMGLDGTRSFIAAFDPVATSRVFDPVASNGSFHWGAHLAGDVDPVPSHFTIFLRKVNPRC